MAAPRVELLLARHADTAWRAAIRPWLEGACGRLVRSYVVVATRGQAQGLKQRCVVESLPLLGVEFLSPGLARQKWLPFAATKPAIGRELLLFELRVAITQRLQKLDTEDPARGLLKSLLSDAERALDDFDELLKAGFGAAGFAHAPLQEIFGAIEARVAELGYSLGTRQSEQAALMPVSADAPKIGGRLLVYGLGAESWSEFFNVAAFVRRFDEITVVLPEPEFRGRRLLDENWVEVWQTFLGTNALPLDALPPSSTCEYVAGWWGAPAQADPVDNAGVPPPCILVGRTRDEEMRLVADEVVCLLMNGAGAIGVVFPKADAAHAGLARLLTERNVPFVDLLPDSGVPPLEVRLQRALLEFYARGGRLEELLALWPLLRASGLASIGPGAARQVCERLFDERQAHTLASYTDRLADARRLEWKEVGRIVALLLPVWPAELTLADALARFQAVCERLSLALPAGFTVLKVFAERGNQLVPASEVFALLKSFLPEKSPAAGGTGRSGFARVTLTTRRRAEGLAWSHVIFVESNAGVWPERRSPSGWLPDEQRVLLNQGSRFSLGVFSADDRGWLEKRGYAALARDTSSGVVFSAAISDDQEPEIKLVPNSWLERVLWRTGVRGGDIQAAFEKRVPPAFPPPKPSDGVKAWLDVWSARRNPARAFDEYFFSVDPMRVTPGNLSARLLEAAVSDPAELWFGAVLGVSRVEQGPFLRSRRRALGQLAHRVVAAALRGDYAEGAFFEKPELETARRRLTAELRRMRELWPADRLWDSFHAGLTQVSTVLLENLFALQTGRVMATELRLPEGAVVPFGENQCLSVTGRMDVLISDRSEWTGAEVDVVDFKTGNDPALSAERMARKGTGLQLAIYLAAVRSLGARAGRVWMVKPERGDASAMEMAELEQALLPLKMVMRHLASGCYGALTPDRSVHGPGVFFWPLACAPVPASVLREKFVVTFGEALTATETEGANE